LTSVQPIPQGSQVRAFSYDSLGRLASAANPGRKLNYGYDGAGRENSLSGTVGGQGKNYVTYVGYAPDSQIGLIGYGNNVWRATSYNSRLEPFQELDVINNDISKLLRSECLYWSATHNLTACDAGGHTDNNGNLK